MPPQGKKKAFFPQGVQALKIYSMLGYNFAKNKPEPMPSKRGLHRLAKLAKLPEPTTPPEPAAGWLESLPTETKTQLSALCRHYGQEFKEDLPQIIAAYYDAKHRAKQRTTI
jgi:hypothetical protein